MVKNTIENTVRTYSNDTGPKDKFGYNLSAGYETLFEMIKLNIRGQTIAFSSKKARKRNKNDANLEEKITILEKSLQEFCNVGDTAKTAQIQNELEHAKLQLIKVREPLVKAAILRSKCQYYEEGEKSTKYFCNLEKRNYISKTIYKLNVDGEIITSPINILTEQKKFYKHIYSSRVPHSETNNQRFLEDDGSVIPLTDNEKLKCEGPVTEQEAKSVIKSMKNNKSPGTDGFPVKFYKFFWSDIGKLLINSLNESFDKGHLSLTQRQSIITCIPKGNTQRIYEQQKANFTFEHRL